MVWLWFSAIFCHVFLHSEYGNSKGLQVCSKKQHPNIDFILLVTCGTFTYFLSSLIDRYAGKQMI